MKRGWAGMAVILAGLLIMGAAFYGVASAGDNGKDTETETLHIRPGHLRYSGDKIELSKGVEIFKDEGKMTVNATSGIYFSEKSKADLQGPVELTYEDGVVNSGELTAWLERDEYLFKKEVKLKHRVNEDEEMILNAPYLKFFLEDNSFQAEGGASIDYNERILKGDYVNYNDQDQSLELTGNVYIEEDNGDWIKGNKAFFNLETEEFTVDGEIELEVKLTRGS